uniref:Uncharacterized protein n=1 Tax=Meloidogyne incognita TaxID=6306 RepID=A0A914L9I0_MELIC
MTADFKEEIKLKENKQIDNFKFENISLIKKLEIAEKRELEAKMLEDKLRSELHELRLQWRQSVKELEALQKELRECKISRQEMESQLKRFEREIIKYKGQIEALEMDRRRVDAIIKQTTLERNALNKSLNTMERENSELQKYCRSLQSQVERLEQDGDERAEQLFKRKIINLETELTKIGQQKKQLENLLVQKESSREPPSIIKHLH